MESRSGGKEKRERERVKARGQKGRRERQMEGRKGEGKERWKEGRREGRRKKGRREEKPYFPTLSHILFEAFPEQETHITAR